MVTILEIDNTQRIISSRGVRGLLGYPSPSTWAKWRSRVGAKGAHYLSCREVILLMVLRRFTARRIQSRLDAYEHAEILLRDIPRLSDRLHALAGDAPLPPRLVPDAIAFATGRCLSIATIRRYAAAANVRFSLMGDIPAKDVRAIAEIAIKKRTKSRKSRK
ncbi:MAG: hypothetical protein HC771_13115 [Synechococcales cyanobacterium CRU_2_2]|nr:hypothetical protein [Synechococcales cyanobacterium CRU_2_2]